MPNGRCLGLAPFGKKGTVHALATLAWDSPHFSVHLGCAYMLSWRFWSQCLGFWLSFCMTCPVSVIQLLFGLVSGINEGVWQGAL